MAPSRSIELRGPYTLTRKISYRRMPRQIIVVGVPREHLFIAHKEKKQTKYWPKLD